MASECFLLDFRHETLGQPGWPQVRYIARNARRCALVASRWSRPRSRATPAPFNTTGTRLASQPRRRTVSAGSGWPSPVSQMLRSCNPARRVSTSINTVTSGTRRSRVRAPVTNPTIASAFN